MYKYNWEEESITFQSETGGLKIMFKFQRNKIVNSLGFLKSFKENNF